MTNDLANKLVTCSQWLDDWNNNRDPEAVTWARLAKVSEEAGEVVSAYIGATGQNRRKGITHTMGDVESELLDVALTALGAYEHVTGHNGQSMEAFRIHLDKVMHRVGLL